MSDEDHARIATLNERSSNHKDRIEKLEGNQRWVVVGLLSAIAKPLFDFIKGGAQ